MDKQLSQKGLRWGRLAALAIFGTLGALVLSVGLHYLLFFGDDINPYRQSLIAAVALPVLIALPLFLFIGYKLETLRQYRRELNFAAAHDPSTRCLNGSAFSDLVDRRRSVARTESGRTFGALLVVTTDLMKEIGFNYGFRWREESMRLAASLIRANVRHSDIVGRLSEREFGIFLPGASVEQAKEVGERIRTAAKQASLMVEDQPLELSLEIGGVIFEDQIEFDGLMRIASQQLELARSAEADGFRLTELERRAPNDRPGGLTQH